VTAGTSASTGPRANSGSECLNSDRFADVVTANITLGQRLGVPGTPGIFVHHGTGSAQRLGGFQFIDIQQAMEAGPGN